MPQSLVSLINHVVFSTKNREPFIDTDLAPRLYSYMGGIARNTARSCSPSAASPITFTCSFHSGGP